MSQLITYVSGGLLTSSTASSCRIDNSVFFDEEDFQELAFMRQTFHESIEKKNLSRTSYTRYLLSMQKEMQRNEEFLHNLCTVFLERHDKRREKQRSGRHEEAE